MECLAKVENLQTRLDLFESGPCRVSCLIAPPRAADSCHVQHPGRGFTGPQGAWPNEDRPNWSGIAAIVVVGVLAGIALATAMSNCNGSVWRPGRHRPAQPPKSRPGRAVSPFSQTVGRRFVGQPRRCWHRCTGLLHKISRQAVRFRSQFDTSQYQVVGHNGGSCRLDVFVFP